MTIELSRNLLVRIVSAVLLLPPVIGAVYFGGWWFYGFLLLAGALMVLEWNRLVGCDYTLMDVIGIVAVGTVAIPFLGVLEPFGSNPIWFVVVVSTTLLGALILELKFLKNREVTRKSPSLIYSCLGILLIASAIAAFAWLRSLDNGLIVMWVLLCVWAMDVGGYFAGKGIGGPKMSPRISPNKTWAGLIGGMLLAAVVASVFALTFGWRDVSSIALAGAIVALIAQLGDLYESSVKRRFHAKDSGELIPGHGGILDRVDGLISAAPIVALYLSFLQLTS